MHPVWTAVLERILDEGWESAGVIELVPKREEMLSSLWTVMVEGCLAVGTDERKVRLFILNCVVAHSLRVG